MCEIRTPALESNKMLALHTTLISSLVLGNLFNVKLLFVS